MKVKLTALLESKKEGTFHIVDFEGENLTQEEIRQFAKDNLPKVGLVIFPENKEANNENEES
jgi:hypothetical protein